MYEHNLNIVKTLVADPKPGFPLKHTHTLSKTNLDEFTLQVRYIDNLYHLEATMGDEKIHKTMSEMSMVLHTLPIAIERYYEQAVTTIDKEFSKQIVDSLRLLLTEAYVQGKGKSRQILPGAMLVIY